MREQLFSLSNLLMRSNLLSERYQDRSHDRLRELDRISVFEIRDVKRRNPNLIDSERFTEAQKQQWRDSLFWGQSVVTIEDDDRVTVWLEPLTAVAQRAVETLERRPNMEEAFELLYLCEELRQVVPAHEAQASEWSQRIRRVLERHEFRLTPKMIQERLNTIMGSDRFREESEDGDQSYPSGRTD